MNPAVVAYLRNLHAQLQPRPDPVALRLAERERAETINELLAEVEAHAKLRPPPTEDQTAAARAELAAIEELARRGLWP
jgi:hypothetical protein